MQQRVIFRTDGGQLIGLGHIMRSLSLANYLKEEYTCTFATKNADEQIHQVIRQSCNDILQLPESENHFDAFLDQLNGNEIVVLDNYYFSTDYQKQIKKKGCSLVCIDDKQDQHFVADLVINHAEGVEREGYSVETYTKLLLGYKYALVRPEFINSTSTANSTEVNDILICIGGADPLNISEKIIASLLSGEEKYQIHLVIGAANQHKERLENIFKNQELRIYSNLSSCKLADLMKKSDFGIFPASTIAIEACAARLPFASGYFVDNQYQIYNGLIKGGLAFGLGDLITQTKEALSSRLKSFIQDTEQTNFIRQKQREKLDTNIKSRYLHVFKELEQR